VHWIWDSETARVRGFACSVVGLNFDFVVLNFTKHTSYLIYNAALYFSPVVQKQYHEKYGYDEVPSNGTCISKEGRTDWPFCSCC
jgi:hypothetical protein